MKMRVWRFEGVIWETEFELQAAVHVNKEICNPNIAITPQESSQANQQTN